MARHGRWFSAGQLLHVIQRGNNRQPIFFADDDYAHYRDWLGQTAAARGCSIHAYVLMPNHVHLLLTPASPDSLPRLMQALGRRYVRFVNDTHGRSGTLWEGRYRAAPIEAEAHFLTCARYIEMNPVRAGLVDHARDYRWSSHLATAEGRGDPLVAEHPVYTALHENPVIRRATYWTLFGEPLDATAIESLRKATNGGWALGGDSFTRSLEAKIGRPVVARPRGRPRKAVVATQEGVS